MKPLSLSFDDFKNLRDNDRYYVDKTGLIGDIINGNAQVYLFTRPRRFGKTLNLSMLDAFFNLEYRGISARWFEGLEISEHEDLMAMANDSPVIMMSLKGMDSNDFDIFVKDFRSKMEAVSRRFFYLVNWDKELPIKRKIRNLIDGTADLSDLKSSLADLSEALEEYHGKKVIILIDEYDDPINRSFGKDTQEKIIEFMRGLVSGAMKTNSHLRFGVVTGIMQIAKESIFSGLNNLYINNVFSTDFDECFGFTESEVKEMITYYGRPEKMDEVREWYDGYRFGGVDVYNPWSVLRYIDSGFVPEKYWAGTSGNMIIPRLLDVADEDAMEDLRTLSSGGSIEKDMDPYIVFADMEKNRRSLYSVMVMSGYLKASRTLDGYALSIPNKEMFKVYSGMFLDSVGLDDYGPSIRKLIRAMQNGDTEGMGTGLQDLMKATVSAKILDSEHAYQTYLIGLTMGFFSDYEIYGDTLESGDGFADIIFKRKKGHGVNMVIEIKRSGSDKDLEKDAQIAMDQILQKDYAHGLQGRTILYGMSFHSKKPYIISKELPAAR